MRKQLCECCQKEIENAFGGSHFCSPCAVHHRKLKQEITILEAKLKRILEKHPEINIEFLKFFK